MPIEWVFFDVGETLVDETRLWDSWADWLGIPRLTLFAALGAAIARGRHHHQAFDMVRPGIDLHREAAGRAAAGIVDAYEQSDLYADALPCLRQLGDAGMRIGIAGNQPTPTMLAQLTLPANLVTTSSQLGVEKPSPEFFRRLAAEAQAEPHRCVSVGDRIDNDIIPARTAGFRTVLVRRGPWGHLVEPACLEAADLVVESLAEIPGVMATLGSVSPDS